MFKLSRRTIVSAGLVGILVIGTCACTSSVETKTEVSTETTNEDGTTTTESTKTTTENGSTTTETSSSITVDINSWTNTWKGDTENGKTVFYAESPSDTSQALIAIYDPEAKELVTHHIGEATREDNSIIIKDATGSGDGFAFGIESQSDDGTTVLDLGKEYGKTTVKHVEKDTFIADLKEADPSGEFLNLS